ncbi:polysaccharide pyruvyl transferase family protein [Roseivivax sp. THAF197b]|uniref:polysaccharide pyruvyl transferase family protein n=1 Tax=Roseivivax sp. THAF197b TaxID=2588299 RepID=UPI001561D597|nr:polysaccharide pyruvyl transferase family protein [Roseivivax sp. THAF197b]
MKYIFINDTRTELHWGCYGVSTEVQRILKSKGSIEYTITTAEIKSLSAKSIIRRIKKIDPAGEYRIVINGEGSINFDNIEGEKLFDIIEAIENSYEIWNASIYELDRRWIAQLSRSIRIIVRDQESLDLLSKNGIIAEYSPDLFFSFLSKSFPCGNGMEKYIVTDSINRKITENVKSIKKIDRYNSIDPKAVDIRFNLKTTLWLRKNLPILKTIRYDPWSMIRILVRQFRQPSQLNHINLTSETLVFTGRYHFSIYALSRGCTLCVFPTNSKKIDSLLKDVSNFGVLKSYSKTYNQEIIEFEYTTLGAGDILNEAVEKIKIVYEN